MRWRLLAGGPLALAIVLAWAPSAWAHASVVASSPSPDQHLSVAPTQVLVQFDQPVAPDGVGLTVLDSNGDQVSTGPGRHPQPSTLKAILPPGLGAGAYVANYTVTSVDGHVVSGGIVFLVGHAAAGAIGQLARQQSVAADTATKAAQFLIYLGVLGAAGLAFFLAFIVESPPEEALLRRIVIGATVLGLAGMLGALGAQAALTAGGGSGGVSWATLRPVIGGALGAQCGVQVVGLALCAWSLRAPSRVRRQFAALYGALLSAGAFVLFGHAKDSVEKWMAIPADVVHAFFAALWLGGLAGLVTVLWARLRAASRHDLPPSGAPRLGGGRPGPDGAPLPAPGSPGAGVAVLERTVAPGRRPVAVGAPAPAGRELLHDTARMVGRFSTMAGISVAILGLAGVLLAISEVGSVYNLFNSSYGQILLVKLAAFGTVMVMAWYNRLLLLPALLRQPDARGAAGGWRMLASTVRIEVIGVVLVLAVTSVLTNSTPSNGASAAVQRPVPFSQTQPFEDGHVTLRITPNQAFVNNFDVQFTDSARVPADKAQTVAVYLTLPAKNVGPIEADMTRVGVGHFVLQNTANPAILGQWQITLQMRVSDFDESDASFVDTVR